MGARFGSLMLPRWTEAGLRGWWRVFVRNDRAQIWTLLIQSLIQKSCNCPSVQEAFNPKEKTMRERPICTKMIFSTILPSPVSGLFLSYKSCHIVSFDLIFFQASIILKLESRFEPSFENSFVDREIFQPCTLVVDFPVSLHI